MTNPIHHPFCNKQQGPLEECSFCRKDGSMDFFTKYPVEGTPRDMIGKYFPDAIITK